jgi:hypothetical protein
MNSEEIDAKQAEWLAGKARFAATPWALKMGREATARRERAVAKAAEQKVALERQRRQQAWLWAQISRLKWIVFALVYAVYLVAYGAAFGLWPSVILVCGLGGMLALMAITDFLRRSG